MKRNHLIGFCFVSVLCVNLAFPQDFFAGTEQTVTLTVEDALHYGVENSKSLKSAEIDLEMKKYASKNSWNVLIPNVQVSGTMARSSNDTVNSSLKSANSSIDMANMLSGMAAMRPGATPVEPAPHVEATESMHWAVVGNVGVSWNLSLAYIGQIKQAKAEYEAGKLSLAKTEREIKSNIKKIFYALLLQQESLEISRASLESSRQRAEQAEINYKNGRVPEIQLLQAQVTYENQKPNVAKAERSFRQSLDSLAFLIGMPIGMDVHLEGEINPTYIEEDYDSLMRKFGGSSLDIRSLDQNIGLVQIGMETIKLSTYTPALALSYGFQPSLSSPFDTNWFDGGNWTDRGSFSVTLAWNLTNLLPWSSTQQQLKKLEDTERQLQVSRDMLLESQKMSVRTAVDALAESREQIAAMERNVELAQRAYDMNWRLYRNGTVERLDLEDSQTQLDNAKLGLASQKFNYISALIDLETTLNTDF